MLTSSIYAVFILSLLLLPVTSSFQNPTGVTSEFHVAEESAIGTRVGCVADNPQLRHQFDDDVMPKLRFTLRHAEVPPGEYFDVDELSGDVTTRQSIDREQVCSTGSRSCTLQLDVIVRPLQYFQIIRVTVVIDDVNDHAPTFPQRYVNVTVKESSVSGSTFPLPVAVDADSGDFGIQGFELTSSSGVFELEVTRSFDHEFNVGLKLTGALDRELTRRYQLIVIAFDGGLPRRSGTMDVSVVVSDANDNSPQFVSASYDVEIIENTVPTSPLVRVQATDADEGLNAEIVYSLAEFSSTEYGQLFHVDEGSGDVYLRGGLDREVQSVYRLTVMATDSGTPSLSAFVRLTVNVLDANDNPPHVVVRAASPDSDVEVLENSESGTFVAYVTATDVDMGAAGEVDCRVAGHDFRLVSLYGSVRSEYKLLTAAVFDREVKSSVLTTLTCTDRGQPSQTVTVELVIQIADENDNSPVIDEYRYDVTVMVAEDSELGTVVASVTAKDDDVGRNAELTYRISATGSTPAQGFSIDENTGEVRVAVKLDFETRRLYEYMVMVSDRGDVPRTATASLTLRVVDVDDERPQFDRQSYYFSVLEGVPVGTSIGRVRATDSDVDSTFSTVRYIILEASNALPFTVDRRTGELTTVKSLDREQTSTYQFAVSAKDTSTTVTSVVVTVNVEDINDNSPVIRAPRPLPGEQVATVWVPGDLAVGSLVTRFEAVDPDDGDNARVTYSLMHGNEGSKFILDEFTGALTTARPFGITHGVYRIVVSAQDQGHPRQMTFVDFVIVVNSTAAVVGYADGHQDLQTSGSTLADDRFLVVIGMICGVVVIVLASALVCAAFILQRGRRKNAKLTTSSAVTEKQAVGLLQQDGRLTGLDLIPARDCVTADNWSAQYNKMIDEIRVNTTCNSAASCSDTPSITLSAVSGARCSHCHAPACCSRRSLEVASTSTAVRRHGSLSTSSVTSASSGGRGRVTSPRRHGRSRSHGRASSATEHQYHKRRVRSLMADTDSDMSAAGSCIDSGLVPSDCGSSGLHGSGIHGDLPSSRSDDLRASRHRRRHGNDRHQHHHPCPRHHYTALAQRPLDDVTVDDDIAERRDSVAATGIV